MNFTLEISFKNGYYYYNFSDNPTYIIKVAEKDYNMIEERIADFTSGKSKNIIFSDVAEFIKK